MRRPDRGAQRSSDSLTFASALSETTAARAAQVRHPGVARRLHLSSRRHSGERT